MSTTGRSARRLDRAPLMTNHLRIDGSYGEGGGQIVRSALALSLVTGRPVTVDNVRAGRPRPGLMRQHLTAVRAAVEICAGAVMGARLGSLSVTFEPRPVRPGSYCFRVGTAGSAALVLQTVLPALAIAGSPSQLTLQGGTDNPWAPPFDFLQQAFLPLLNRMGPRVTASLERRGFYPAGGGQFTVTVEPCAQLAGFQLHDRGPLVAHAVRALVANLPRQIADREVRTVLAKLGWDAPCGTAEQVTAHGRGNVVLVELHSQHVSEVFTGFGRLGVRAEHVAADVARQVTDYLESGAPVGPYLADQLLLPLGVSAWQTGAADRHRGGSFCTVPLTRHALTHIDLLRRFLEIDIRVAAADNGKTCCVSLLPP